MGKALADRFAVARRVFEEADDALGFPISRLCFEGPEEQLKLTENTQPALLTVSTAACAVLGSAGWQPDYVAGHSLGEYSALVAAGSLRSPTPCGWSASAAATCRKPCRRAWAPWPRCSSCPMASSTGSGAGRAGRSGERRQSEFARPGGDRGPRRRREPRHGSGQSGRRAPRRAAAGQRAVPLRADEARPGAAASRSRCRPNSAISPARW